jgi:hypothetical protein
MSDNYLWDKSGETDAEVERLERLLGRFQYQPSPLNLPEAAPRRAFSPKLFAAAAAVVLALGIGLWLGLRYYQQASVPEHIVQDERQRLPRQEPAQVNPGTQPPVEPKNESSPPPDQSFAPAPKPPRRPMRPAPKQRQQEVLALAAEERRAKERLLLALHIASAKLNLAQKKVQESARPVPQS